MSDLPESDRLADAPHPRHTTRLFGQAAAAGQFAEAVEAGRLHHGWLITGPRGVGKATLAWAMARVLLTRPSDTGADGLFGAPEPLPVSRDLSVDPDHPVARRVAALIEPRLSLVRRPWDERLKRLKTEITVDEIRRLKAGFSLSSADAGLRVAIIDSADELNPSAANALLKLLEEPPRDVVLILISHRPARLLPTIRSRCRTIRCAPVTPEDMAQALTQAGIALPEDTEALATLTRLAGGSVGTAVGVLDLDGLDLQAQIVTLLAGMPDHDRQAALKLARDLSAPDAEPRRTLAIGLVRQMLSDIARAGITGQLPADLPAALARLCPDAQAARKWAEAETEIAGRLGHGFAVNLDPQGLILDMLGTLDATASRAVYQTGAA